MDALKPKRQLNLIQTSAIIIGTVIGSGIFMNLPIVADITGSPAFSALIWGIGGLIWIPQILVLAELGTAYPDQGGPYYYIYKAGSPFLAFQYTWTAFWTSDTPSLTIVALIAASAMSYFFPVLGQDMYARLFASLIIIILAYIQYKSVRTGSYVQVILTVSKLLPLIGVVLIGLYYLSQGNLAVTYPETVSGSGESEGLFFTITAGVSSTLWAYAGFLNILYMAGEVKDPNKTLPRSLIGSLLLIIAAYMLISLCTAAIVPHEHLIAAKGDIINPFMHIGFLSSVAGPLFAIAVFVSMLGGLNAMIMTQPRLQYAMARDGLFFEIFGRLHPKHLTPHYSIMLQTILAIVLFVLGDIEAMLGYFTLSYALQNILVYGSIFWLRRKEEYNPSYRSRIWHISAVIAILVQFYLSYGSFIAFPLIGVLASLGLILTGVPVYWYFYTRKQRQAQA